jgi:hypothetical protein
MMPACPARSWDHTPRRLQGMRCSGQALQMQALDTVKPGRAA